MTSSTHPVLMQIEGFSPKTRPRRLSEINLADRIAAACKQE
jgi:hypothetical protein